MAKSTRKKAKPARRQGPALTDEQQQIQTIKRSVQRQRTMRALVGQLKRSMKASDDSLKSLYADLDECYGADADAAPADAAVNE